MKDTYLAKDFRATAARRFPAQAAALNAAFDARLQALRADNAAAGKEKQFHLENQILPGIAAYETLQTVMPKEEALQTVHGYVEQRAWKLRKIFLALMRVPGLPRKTPGIFTKQTRRMFGEAAGFDLTLGSGQFIPGFEDQVVGMNVGEIIDFCGGFKAEPADVR